MTRFLVICTYLGRLPKYFNLFAHSCGFVPEIDFLVLTDASPPSYTLPPNLKIQRLTRVEFQSRTQHALGISGPIPSGYKLNDYKPMYGEIFSDLIAGYDYWGSGDIDLIFSPRLTEFVMAGAAEDADIINTSVLWLHGPLTLFKNSHSMCTLYQKSRHWKNVVESSANFAFDECGTKYAYLDREVGFPSETNPHNRSYLDISPEDLLNFQDFDCMSTVVIRERNAGRCRIFQDFVFKGYIWPGEKVLVKDGEILAENNSWCAYHWYSEKRRRKFSYPSWRKVPETFYIDQYGFFDFRTPWLNRWRHGLAFSQGVLRLLHDRALYHLGQIGLGRRPTGPFE